jgi:hypothetical protein
MAPPSIRCLELVGDFDADVGEAVLLTELQGCHPHGSRATVGCGEKMTRRILLTSMQLLRNK